MNYFTQFWPAVFVVLTLKATVYLDVGVKGFRRGQTDSAICPAFLQRCRPHFLWQEVMTGYDITDSWALSRGEKKAFYDPSVFLPNPFLPCFLSLPHFLPLSTLNENYCHKVKACNVEIRLHTIIGTFALFLTISLLIWLQVFLLQVKKKKKPHWIKCEISMSCMIFNKCCHNLQALNLKCSDITTPEWP